MVREIVFDTETTGLSPDKGDRLVEIGAVELINHLPTGKTYHQYINPERDVPEEVVKVHGLTEEFLKGYPNFAEIAGEFREFVGEDGILVAHNAPFDMGFINFEYKKLGYEPYSDERVIDTLEIARKMFPGAKNSLDALCKRFNVDNSNRTLHGALIDADLLAKVYLELLGGEEPSMLAEQVETKSTHYIAQANANRAYHEPRIFKLSDEDNKAHRDFLADKITNALWIADEKDLTGTEQ